MNNMVPKQLLSDEGKGVRSVRLWPEPALSPAYPGYVVIWKGLLLLKAPACAFHLNLWSDYNWFGVKE